MFKGVVPESLIYALIGNPDGARFFNKAALFLRLLLSLDESDVMDEWIAFAIFIQEV